MSDFRVESQSIQNIIRKYWQRVRNHFNGPGFSELNGCQKNFVKIQQEQCASNPHLWIVLADSAFFENLLVSLKLTRDALSQPHSKPQVVHTPLSWQKKKTCPL